MNLLTTHLAAESGKEDDQLNRVDVIGDENEGSLLVLNESDDYHKLASETPIAPEA